MRYTRCTIMRVTHGLRRHQHAWAIALALSDFADAAIAVAARHLLRKIAKAGSITLPSADEPERGSGLIVLALGKLGARELNYSSDVDLIVVHRTVVNRFEQTVLL